MILAIFAFSEFFFKSEIVLGLLSKFEIVLGLITTVIVLGLARCAYIYGTVYSWY